MPKCFKCGQDVEDVLAPEGMLRCINIDCRMYLLLRPLVFWERRWESVNVAVDEE